jgi:HSP20 family protein
MAGDFIRVKHSCFFLPAGQSADSSAWQPPADIYRTRIGWLVKFDLAGVRAEDVRLTAQDNRLTVRGVRRDCCLEEGHSYYQMEISYSHFERSVTLPVALDKAALTLENRDGMLLIHIRPEAGR